MPDRPLLLFPMPQMADKTKKYGGFGVGDFHKPDIARQGQRLCPMFKKLEDSFESKGIRLQQNAAGKSQKRFWS